MRLVGVVPRSKESRSMATDATLVETHNTPDHDTLVPDPMCRKSLASPPCRSGAGTETPS